MTNMFPTAKCGAKTNVQRIAQKIEEIMKEDECDAKKAWVKLSDILRCRVILESPAEVKEFFLKTLLPAGNICQILRFKPRFQTFLHDAIINFNWLEKYICELKINIGDGSLARGYEEQLFVYKI